MTDWYEAYVYPKTVEESLASNSMQVMTKELWADLLTRFIKLECKVDQLERNREPPEGLR